MKKISDAERELAVKFEDECMPNGTMGTVAHVPLPERIVAAAIQYAGIVFSIAPPARHHNVIRLMMRLDLDLEAVRLQNQGFLTSHGRFVDRYEGAKIARAAGQIIREPTPPDMLTSEDVW